MKKKIMTGALTVTMLLGAAAALPQAGIPFNDSVITASAADNVSGYWTYEVNGGKATITSYTGLDENVTIPSKLGGYTVTAIGAEAFENNTEIRTVTIPSTVTYIGGMAFYGSGLTTLTVPKSVTTWAIYSGDRLQFANCPNLTTVNFNSDTVPYSAFKDCPKLKTVTLSSATTIHDSAFSGCTALSKITLGGNVTEIGDGAFYNTSALSTIDLGSKLKSIGYYAFENSGLTSVTIPSSVETFVTSSGNSRAFTNCPKLTTVTFNADCVPEQCFDGCTKLKTVDLSATMIDGRAFLDCTSLTTVNVHKNIYSIGWRAFENCSSLKAFNFGRKLDYLGNSAFRNTALSSVCIPSTVNTWYNSASYGRQFEYCPNLKNAKIGLTSELPETVFDNDKVTIKTIKDSSAYAYAKAYNVKNSTFEAIPATSAKFNKSIFNVKVGDTLRLYPTIAPVSTTDAVSWKSGDENVASVDSTGLVTANKEGNVAIKITTTSGKTATCTIKVSSALKSSDVDKPTAQSLAGATVENISDKAYTGSAIKPTPAVTLNACTMLVPDEDFTYSYSNNTNIGTATLTITGKGAFSGTITKTFNIKDFNIANGNASIAYSSYTYRGRAIKPTVTVKNASGKKLTKGTDYTVSYSNNTNVGTATITIKGAGKYTGTLKKTFKVKALDLSSSYAKFSIPYSSYTYTGSQIKPAVTVKFKDGDVIPATQYTVSYSNNTKVGVATITVKAKGSNTTGSYKKTFVVKPAKNAIKSISSTKGAFKITWTKATAGATGYQVEYSTDKNFKTNVHSYTSTKLSDLSESFSSVPKSGETWYVKVRSFVTKDGKASSTRYGNYSDVKTITIK